jgi:drug/metabolite transporter (DMT)-like permease
VAWAFIVYFGILGNWGAVRFMPIYMSGCIVFTMPIWSSFMAFFILKESLSKYNVLGLFFTFAGVLIINDPFGFFSIYD